MLALDVAEKALKRLGSELGDGLIKAGLGAIDMIPEAYKVPQR